MEIREGTEWRIRNLLDFWVAGGTQQLCTGGTWGLVIQTSRECGDVYFTNSILGLELELGMASKIGTLLF